MPKLIRRKKDNWWVVPAGLALVGAWLTVPFLGKTGSESIDGADRLWRERSLGNLNTLPHERAEDYGVSSPPEPGSGVGSRGGLYADAAPRSSLYRPPAQSGSGSASREAILADRKEKGDGPEDLLAALARARDRGRRGPPAGFKASRGGSKKRSARESKRRKKKKLRGAPSSKIGNKGFTSASYTLVDKAFGTGGDPGNSSRSGGASFSGRGAREASNRAKRSKTTRGSSAGGSGAMTRGHAALARGGDERLVASGRRTFDGAAARQGSTALEALQDAAAPGLLHDEQSPVNLKSNDFKQLDGKEIKLPKMRNYRQERLDRMEKRLEERKQMMRFVLQLIMSGVSGGFSRMLGKATSSGLGYGGIGGSAMTGTSTLSPPT